MTRAFSGGRELLRGGEKLLEEGHEPSRADFSSGPDMPDMPDRPAGDARDLVAGSGLPKICHTPVLETAAGALRWVDLVGKWACPTDACFTVLPFCLRSFM